MTYATVMVSLALNQSNDARLEVAGQLSERFDATVIGIVAAQFSPPPYFSSGEMAQRLLDEGQAAIRSRIAALETQFRTALQRRGKALEWRSAEEFPARFVAREARAADVIVAGSNETMLANPFEQTDPGDLVMQVGRPVLVVPETGSWLDLRSILVAWKDTPEARRAVADALPILRKAKDVSVVEIVEDGVDRRTAIARVKDVAAWLSRHGVLANQQVPDECGHAAEQLNRIASELNAGVVVAGAYGHSRIREWILGGVSRNLIHPRGRCSLLSR